MNPTHPSNLCSLPETARGRIRPDWIDYNGHMNVAYYVLAFEPLNAGE